MSLINRLLKNTAALMTATALQPILNFLLVLFISRYYGKSGLGEYTTAFALLNMFQLFCAFNMRMLLAREVAKYPNDTNKYLMNGLLVVFLFSTISIIAMLTMIQVLNYEPAIARMATVLSVSLLATGGIECFIGILTGHEQLRIVAVMTILEELVKVGLSIFLLYKNAGIFSVAVVFTVLRFFNMGATFAYISRKLLLIKWQLDCLFGKHLILLVRYFALSILFVSIFWQLDVVLISKLKGIEAVGVFSAAFRISRITFLLFQSFIVAFYPVLCKLHKESLEKAEHAFFRASKYLIILAIPVVLFVIFLADDILLLLFGQDFKDSILVLKLLIGGLIPYLLMTSFSHLFLATGHQKIDFVMNVIGVIFKFSLIYICAQFGGIYLVAIMSTLSLCVMFVFQWAVLLKKSILQIRFRRLSGPIFKIGVAAGSMLVIVLMLKPLTLYGALVVSLLAYFAVLYWVKAISTQDRNFLLAEIKRRIRPVSA